MNRLDKQAFSGLYETVYKDMYYFALYMMKNPQDAEDAVSEAVMAAYQNIHKLNCAEAFRSWIFKILSNTCKKKLIKRSRKEKHEAVRELREEESSDWEFPQEAQDVRDAWETLTEEERHIVALSVFGGYNSQEIGELFQINANTVRSKRSRALGKMKALLQ